MAFFDELLSTQNVNVARFARDVDDTFFVVFKHCANDIFGVLLFISRHHLSKKLAIGHLFTSKVIKGESFFTTFLQLLWLSEYRTKISSIILMERERLFLVSMQVISSGNADFFKSCSPDLNATVAKEGIK